MAKKVAFVGIGMIGAGLAANAALGGFDVALYDIVDCSSNVSKVLDILTKTGVCTREQADAALANCHYTADLKEAVEGAVFVQECIAEREELKRETYRKIQEVVGDTAVICSSTSMMLPSVLQKDALHPECIIVGHPYNPSYLLPLIELCGGEQASPAMMDRAVEIYKQMGKEPIVCQKEAFGFIANMVSWAAFDAAKKAIVDGLCTVEDMDKAIMYGPGMRLAITGIILTMSLGVKGGLRSMGDKYGQANPVDLLLADGIDVELANRPEWQGKDHESAAEFRDQMIADILKLHGYYNK